MKYFTFYELEYSQSAISNNIKNFPTAKQEENLRLLVENLLDPIRERWGKPISIGSGFRNARVNALVGGASNSQHMQGCAADLQTGSIDTNRQLFNLIQSMGGFDQLINEYGYKWVHVSYNPDGKQRGQVLTIK
jgi:hypothetical protein